MLPALLQAVWVCMYARHLQALRFSRMMMNSTLPGADASSGVHDSSLTIGAPSTIKASMLLWRMATLNLEQNHKRWDVRRELVIDQLAVLQPVW
jgi:hypothetical protein